LQSEGGSGAVTAGDYDNDGYLDLFITSIRGGNHLLYHNLRDGIFESVKSKQSEDSAKRKEDEMFRAAQGVIGYDASFLDFDNDGFLDLLIAGESTEKEGR
jgi:hypothetical protein